MSPHLQRGGGGDTHDYIRFINPILESLLCQRLKLNELDLQEVLELQEEKVRREAKKASIVKTKILFCIE